MGNVFTDVFTAGLKYTNGLQEFYDTLMVLLSLFIFLIPKSSVSSFCNCMDYKHNSSKFLFSSSHMNVFIINCIYDSRAMFIIQSHLEDSF